MTMLLSNHHELQYPRVPRTHSLNYWTPSSTTPPVITTTMPSHYPVAKSPYPQVDDQVVQALEIARDSPEGSRDPSINSILETALAQIWFNIQTRPNTYIMSRDEFAVFNFFQHRFVGNSIAIAARKRYWDNAIYA